MNILLLYNFTPGTTAWYVEQALRKQHNVKTCGTCSKGYAYHDIRLNGPYVRLDQIYRKLCSDWQVDVFIMVDSAYNFFLKGISRLPVPTVFYAIDTYSAFPSHKAFGRLFDLVFVAQKEFVEPLKKSGCKNCFWLPLACDPEIYPADGKPKSYDVCFLGTQNPRRKELLDRLSRKFKVLQDYKPFDEVAGVYSQSKIVFNKSVKNDLNMRVFEAMCSGSMLLTDRLKDNGLEDLFQDRKHLVLYDEDNLEELAGYYLTHEQERERIARQAREYVLNNHTYQQRAKQMLGLINDFTLRKGHLSRKKINEPLLFAKIWFLQSRFSKLIKKR